MSSFKRQFLHVPSRPVLFRLPGSSHVAYRWASFRNCYHDNGPFRTDSCVCALKELASLKELVVACKSPENLFLSRGNEVKKINVKFNQSDRDLIRTISPGARQLIAKLTLTSYKMPTFSPHLHFVHPSKISPLSCNYKRQTWLGISLTGLFE